MLDISEHGGQIGEKSFTVLSEVQEKELWQFMLSHERAAYFHL